jgi:hypothetical protein
MTKMQGDKGQAGKCRTAGQQLRALEGKAARLRRTLAEIRRRRTPAQGHSPQRKE